MSSMDHKDMSDEEFEALLQGRGELADMLRAVPQPQPSAELDAAILADAQAALQAPEKSASAAPAANDPVIPEGGKTKRAGFLRRWRVPLAFAASALLALQMIESQWYPTWTAHEAAAPAAAPTAPAASPAPVSEPVAAAAPAAAMEQAKTAAPAVVAQAERREVQGRLREQLQVSGSAPDTSAKKSKARQLEEPMPPVAMADSAAKPSAKSEMTQAPAAAAPAESSQAIGSIAQGPGKASGMVEQQPQEAKALAKRENDKADNLAVATAPAAAPPVNAYRSAPAPVAAAPAADARAPAADTSTQGDAQKDPKTWLARIDKLIKADAKKEALDEWTKFRQAYPNYPVPKELSDRAEALKK